LLGPFRKDPRVFPLPCQPPPGYTLFMVIRKQDDILELLREEGAEAARKAQRGLIIQPGAIGDSILALPLAAFMKETLNLGGIDMLGHTEYIGFLPGRSSIDSVTSIDSVDLHRLFVNSRHFDLADRDPLISVFTGYAWIATFLGEPGSDFEHNLIYTANCSGSSEVVTLSMKPPANFSGHLTEFYTQQFIAQTGLSSPPRANWLEQPLIRPTRTDIDKGRALTKEAGLDPDRKPVVIHPGSGGLGKCWHIDNFLAIAEELIRRDEQVLFLLGPAEMERLGRPAIKKLESCSNCLAGVSLLEVLQLLSCAGAFIGNDSGITHLAASLGVRTFALFGPTNPCLYGPVGPNVTTFKNSPRTFSKQPSPRAQHRVLAALAASENRL